MFDTEYRLLRSELLTVLLSGGVLTSGNTLLSAAVVILAILANLNLFALHVIPPDELFTLRFHGLVTVYRFFDKPHYGRSQWLPPHLTPPKFPSNKRRTNVITGQMRFGFTLLAIGGMGGQITADAVCPLPHFTRTFGQLELPTMVTPSLQRAICFPSSLKNLTLAPVCLTISATRLQKTSYDITETILSAILIKKAAKPPVKRPSLS